MVCPLSSNWMQLVASPELTTSPQTPSSSAHPPLSGTVAHQSWALPSAASDPRVAWPLPASSISSPSVLSLPHFSSGRKVRLLRRELVRSWERSVGRCVRFPQLCNGSPQTWWLNTEEIRSLTVQKPDVQNPGGGRVLLLLKAPGRSPSWMQLPEVPGDPCCSSPCIPITPISASVFT